MTQDDLPDNLKEYTSDELEKRLADLNKRFYAARRLNMGDYVYHQLDLLITEIEYEKERRYYGDKGDLGGVILDTDPIK